MEAERQIPFYKSLAIQARVVCALLTRELLKSFGRQNIGFLWIFLGPIIFVLTIMSLHYLKGTNRKTFASVAFPTTAVAVLGYSYLLYLRSMPSDCGGVVAQNRKLLLHRHVRILDLFFARILLKISVQTVALIVLSIFCILVGAMNPPDDYLESLFAWILLMWLGAAIGLSFGPLIAKFPVVKHFMTPWSFFCLIGSGCTWMVAWFPTSIQKLVLWIPTVHGMEMLREGFLGRDAHAQYDISYLVWCCMWFSLFGLAFARASYVAPENE